MDEETVADLFVTFQTTVYVPYFISSSRGVDAALNDLDLFKALESYRSVSSVIAEAALAEVSAYFIILCHGAKCCRKNKVEQMT